MDDLSLVWEALREEYRSHSANTPLTYTYCGRSDCRREHYLVDVNYPYSINESTISRFLSGAEVYFNRQRLFKEE